MLLEIINCNDASLATIFSIVQGIMTIIQISVPIFLIIFATIQFAQLVKNPDSKDGTKKIINKFIAAAIIFFILMTVNIVMNIVGENTELSKCWNEAAKSNTFSPSYYSVDDRERKKTYQNAEDYEKGTATAKLRYTNAVEIPDSVLQAASQSDLSIIVIDDTGNVLAQRKSDVLREGGSTTKVFMGYAAIKLLDPEKDIVVSTQYAENMPYMGDPDVKVGQKLSVSQAATKDFPGSSNITTANIAIAIGKKYYNTSSDSDAYFQGMEKINEFLKQSGCEKTKLVSSSGVNYNYKKGKWGEFDSNGISKGEYGITAAELALIGMSAMKDEYFASGISGRNNNGLFFIKSGTQAYKHGIWGFNHNGKRYYLVALGFNFSKEGDKRTQVSRDIYNWTIKNLI